MTAHRPRLTVIPGGKPSQPRWQQWIELAIMVVWCTGVGAVAATVGVAKRLKELW